MWHGQTSAWLSLPRKEYMASRLWSPRLKTKTGSSEKKQIEPAEVTRTGDVTTHTKYFMFEYLQAPCAYTCLAVHTTLLHGLHI